MKQLNAKIIKNEKVAPGFYKMAVESAYLARNSKPGQFVEVKCSESIEPLLRRPLGVHRISQDGIEILYEVVGKGTQILSGRKAGEMLDVIGPLGNGFDLTRSTNHDSRTTILIAGGIGVAPLLALAEELTCGKKRKIQVLIGAKTKSHIICSGDFKKLGCKVSVSTDDGSLGSKGLVSELLRKVLYAKQYPLNTMIYACGPNAMLRAVARIAKERLIPCQVSLEERMACGLGVCLGCPAKLRNGEYKMVCKDGPVFKAEEIAW